MLFVSDNADIFQIFKMPKEIFFGLCYFLWVTSDGNLQSSTHAINLILRSHF
jgi:hypothetical protein